MHPTERNVWDTLVMNSPGAWFWHLPTWAEYVREASGSAFIDDASFILRVGHEAIAACPVFVEAGPDGCELSMQGGGLPMPALRTGLSDGVRHRACLEYVEHLSHVAATYGAVRASLRHPFADIAGGATFAAWEFWRFGFDDVSLLTQLIDLTAPEQELWTAVRKGHRSDIKRARDTCGVTIWDHATVRPDTFAAYQALHAKDAGRVTRSQRSFDVMHEWIRHGRAVLAEAHQDGRSLAFALIMLHGSRAYYGSGCQDPEHTRLGASHLVQWSAIEWLKAHGCQTYDIGLQHFEPRWHLRSSDKDRSISAFKRGFGGRLAPLPVVEVFYAPAARVAAMGRRLAAIESA